MGGKRSSRELTGVAKLAAGYAESDEPADCPRGRRLRPAGAGPVDAGRGPLREALDDLGRPRPTAAALAPALLRGGVGDDRRRPRLADRPYRRGAGDRPHGRAPAAGGPRDAVAGPRPDRTAAAADPGDPLLRPAAGPRPPARRLPALGDQLLRLAHPGALRRRLWGRCGARARAHA